MNVQEFLTRARWFETRNGFVPSRVKVSDRHFIELLQDIHSVFGGWPADGRLAGIEVCCGKADR